MRKEGWERKDGGGAVKKRGNHYHPFGGSVGNFGQGRS